MISRIFLILAVILAALAAFPAAAQPASERALPFVLAGALRLEFEIEACAIAASASERDQLKQALANLQKRTGLPDEAIAKIRREARADMADPAWKSIQLETCKEARVKFKEFLTEVIERSQ